MKITLASDSPRRKQLLSLLVPQFSAVSHRIDEDEYLDLKPEDMVGQLAVDKAISVPAPDGGIVIGSDLTVGLKDKALGKPKNLTEAKKFLKLLSGKTHTVFCGVAVANYDQVIMSVAKSEVKMKKFSDKIIDEYIKRFHILDKGGAYAIQFELEHFGSVVESFKGGITTIIGLPLDHLANLLKEFGVAVNPDWPERCRQETGFEY